MFIFYRLLLAHVIGDFPLQFTKIYRYKTQSPLGSFMHSSIFSALAIFALWPYWHLERVWEFIFFLWLIHGIQDWLKVAVCDKYDADNLWVFLLDQFLHVGFLCMLFSFGLAKLSPPETLSKFVSLYNDDNLVIYGITFISIGFGGGILISYIKDLLYPSGKIDLVSSLKYVQVLERIAMMALLLLDGYYYLAIPGIWIIHAGYGAFRKGRERRINLSSLFDLGFNTLIAVGIPIILRLS